MEINKIANRTGNYQQNTKSKKQNPSFGVIAVNPSKIQNKTFKRKLIEIAIKNDAYCFGADENNEPIALIITKFASKLEKKILGKFPSEMIKQRDVSIISDKKAIEYIKNYNNQMKPKLFKESEELNYLKPKHFVDALLG